MPDANSENDLSEPFDVLDKSIHQAIDNNGIFFKQIDSTLNLQRWVTLGVALA